MWALTTEILGFEFDGTKKPMWLSWDTRYSLLTILKDWMWALRRINVGMSLDEFESETSF